MVDVKSIHRVGHEEDGTAIWPIWYTSKQKWELNVYIQKKREKKIEPLISQRQRLGLRRINLCIPNMLGPTHDCLPTHL